MIVAYVIPYIPQISLNRTQVGLATPIEMINWSWCLQEAHGLSDYCRVHIVPAGASPPPIAPDLVFAAHDGVAVDAHKLAEHYGVPFAVQVISRLPDYEDAKWKETLNAMKHACCLTGVSPVVCESLKEFGDMHSIPVYMVPHGVNDKVADQIPEQQRKQFVCINVLMKHKHVELLLEAFCRLHRNDLVVIGDGPERLELEVLNKIWCEPAKFLYVVDEWRKFQEIKASRALLSASESEQFLIPAAEAMYSGTPCILRDHPNLRGVYGNANSFLKYYKTLDQLTEHVSKFASKTEDGLVRSGKRARKFVVVKGYTLTQRSERMYNVLAEARAEWKR